MEVIVLVQLGQQEENGPKDMQLNIKEIKVVPLWDRLEDLPSDIRGTIIELMKKEPIYGFLGNQVMPSARFMRQYTNQYLEMSKNPEKFRVSQSDIDYARERLLAATACTYNNDLASFRKAEAFINATWCFIERKMKANPGFYWFFLDNGGVDSMFMDRFYFDIPGTVSPAEWKALKPEWRSNPALQMDTAFACYRDLAGVYRQIPNNDLAMRQCIQESIWSGVRFRILLHIYYALKVGEGAHILELCGGALQALRRCGYLERNLRQKFVVYDSNPQIKDVLPIVFEKPIEDYGIDYRFASLFEAANDPELQGKQDLVRIQGGMSYFVQYTEQILYEARQALRTGGYCTLDLQLKDINLLKCQSVLEHNMPGTNMQPDDDVISAIKRIEKAIAEVGGFEIELAVSDAKINVPCQATTVFIALKKVA